MVDGEEKEFPIKYGGGEDEEGKDGESKESEEGKEPETKPDELSEPADEESEMTVEDEHDEL